MKILFIVFSFVSLFNISKAQTTESINSDRPGQTTSPLTVGKNIFQVQSGLNYLNKSFANSLTIYSISNSTNIRFGLSKTFELNGSFGFKRNENVYSDPLRDNFISSGLENLRLGARLNLLNKGGLTPIIAIYTNILFALENEVSFLPNGGLELKISIRQPLTNKLALTSNLGVFHNPYMQKYFYPYTLNSSYIFNNELFAFFELYGLLNFDKTINYDAGIGYYLSNNLLLDISGGVVPINEIMFIDRNKEWYIDAGVSFRFGGVKKRNYGRNEGNHSPRYKEIIYSDRPGQTTNPHTVGIGVSQIQFGVNYYEPNISNNNFVFRFGITEKFELNGGFNTTLDFKEEARHGNDGIVSGTQFGISYFSLGARYNLIQRDDYTPSIGIQGTAYIDAGSYYDSDGSSFLFLLSADQKVKDELSLGGNLIMNNGADLSLSNFSYTAYTSYSYKDFSFLLEMYGRLDPGFETFWDFGVSYLSSENLIFDINYGQRSLLIFNRGDNGLPGLSKNENFWNAEIGLTYRIPKN